MASNTSSILCENILKEEPVPPPLTRRGHVLITRKTFVTRFVLSSSYLVSQTLLVAFRDAQVSCIILFVIISSLLLYQCRPKSLASKLLLTLRNNKFLINKSLQYAYVIVKEKLQKLVSKAKKEVRGPSIKTGT